MDERRALITGVLGQDGTYLTELLLAKDYKVHGVTNNLGDITLQQFTWLEHVRNNQSNFTISYVDLTDPAVATRLVNDKNPHEIYNLAAQSNVGRSFSQPLDTVTVNTMITVNLLEAIKSCCRDTCKFFQAGSSEMFGKTPVSPQHEDTKFYPRSPYGCSKVFAHDITKVYKEAHNMFACTGILYGHESPRRTEQFVFKKITSSVARIACGLQDTLTLGSLDVMRDWGYAPDYVEAMWRMLQIQTPTNFVIGTGETHSVRELAQEAFLCVGITDYEKYIILDTDNNRPLEVNTLQADSTKASDVLGWRPTVTFKQLVEIMVKHDLESIKKEKNA